MAKLVFAMNQSLDGYVDHAKIGPPDPEAFRHFIELTRSATGFVYGRNLYEIMSYWQEDLPDWDEADREFAEVWRKAPKWVASRTLKAVGPNATLIEGDVEAAVRELKAELEGEIHVGGPVLAGSLSEAGLIDEYRLYMRPVVLGSGARFFVGEAPKLRLVGSDRVSENIVRLTYVPA
jgi:dihydrofolate reductase